MPPRRPRPARPARPVAGVLLGVLVITTGCSDDAGGGPDAGLQPYDDPSDFPRDGCSPGGLAMLTGRAAASITHLEIRYPDYPRFVGSTALRLDPGPTGPAALMAGGAATVTVASADDLVVRQDFADGAGVRALDLCGSDGAGELRGHYVLCRDGTCLAATVRGKVVERLAEAEASGLSLLGEHGGRAAWPTTATGCGWSGWPTRRR